MTSIKSSRRGFIKKVAGTALVSSLAPAVLAGPEKSFYLEAPAIENKMYGANDQVNVAIIGMGIMGFNN
jgi:hypothetical protein